MIEIIQNGESYIVKGPISIGIKNGIDAFEKVLNTLPTWTIITLGITGIILGIVKLVKIIKEDKK